MHTPEEIEEQLGQAAQRMRLVSKAQKDQASKSGPEPVDVLQPPLGDLTDAATIASKPPGQNVP